MRHAMLTHTLLLLLHALSLSDYYRSLSGWPIAFAEETKPSMRQPPACWSDWTKVAFDLLHVCAYKGSAVFFPSPSSSLTHTSWSLGSRLAMMMMNVFFFCIFELLLRINNC